MSSSRPSRRWTGASGRQTPSISSDPAIRANSWVKWQSLFDHLARTGDLAWLAEDAAGTVVGYARSINRDGVRELTEFFVLPAWQARGVGRELLRRAFPAEGARRRTIIATLELGALGRYLKTGLSARCLILYCSAEPPRPNPVSTDLQATRIVDDDAGLGNLNRIDAEVLGHTREVDHRWLLAGTEREGFLFRRGGRAVAYGYVGDRSGPIAVLDANDTAAVLGFLESRAAELGLGDVGVLAAVGQPRGDCIPPRSRLSDRPLRDDVLQRRSRCGARSLPRHEPTFLRLRRTPGILGRAARSEGAPEREVVDDLQAARQEEGHGGEMRHGEQRRRDQR